MKKIVEEAKKIAGVEKMDLYLTDEEIMKQDQEYYYNKGKTEGYDKGKIEGYDKSIIEIIVNMKKMGCKEEDIIKITGKSFEIIKKILNDE